MLSPLRSSNVPDRGAAFLLPAALVDDCRNGEHDEDQRQTDDRDGVALTAMHAALRAASLDHLVGDQQQITRNFQIECSGALEIDDKLVFGRLLDGKIGRFCTLQNLADIDCRASERVRPDVTIRHEAASNP